MAKDLGVSSVYIEDLISRYNFEDINKIYDSAEALAVLKVCFVDFVLIRVIYYHTRFHLECMKPLVYF